MYNSMKDLLPDWLAALRSGKYKQGKEMLRSSDEKFCCLGVAADLLVKQGQAKWSSLVASYGLSYEDRNIESAGFLSLSTAPAWLRGWLAAKADREGELEVCREARLVRENDRGKSFAEIADMIEQWENQ